MLTSRLESRVCETPRSKLSHITTTIPHPDSPHSFARYTHATLPFPFTSLSQSFLAFLVLQLLHATKISAPWRSSLSYV